jgi:hypothetical protein
MFPGHIGPVRSVAATPDSQRIVTGGEDGTTKLWDAVSGREILTLRGHTGTINSVTVTPDGRRLLTGGQDATARLWDAVSGSELLTLRGHIGAINSVAVTPDGRRVLTGGKDGTVRIWDTASREQAARWSWQDQETLRRSAAWRLPTPGAPGFIQDWLVLAPLPLEAGQSGAEGLEREQVLGEARLRPRAGDRVPGRDLTWQTYRGDEPILDFTCLVGEKPSENCVAYAVCYVISDTERNDLLLQVSSDDEAKIYLNGQEVYKYSRGRSLTTLDPVGPVTLRKGTNVLVFKVVNELLGWFGCLRFVDPEGNPVPLEGRLTPE